jgi:hypothetical protein
LTNEARLTEIAKYVEAYKKPSYKMGMRRKDLVCGVLKKFRDQGLSSYLDIGTGRGEALGIAAVAGYTNIKGYEVVQDLCDSVVMPFEGIHNIPEDDNSWELVTAFDVFEHLIEADVSLAVQELVRVASKVVVLTVASFPHGHYHITLQDPQWWQNIITQAALPTANKIVTCAGWHDMTKTFEIWK